MALFEKVATDPLLQFFVQLALTLAFTRILGKLFSFINQPQVVGEIIAGVLLGPSVLGRIPGFTAAVWPTKTPLPPSGQLYDSTVTFTVIADVGVVLFMFMLGCELDHHRIKQQWRQSLPIAISAIVFPFAVGTAASFWLEGVNAEDPPMGWEPPRFRSFMLFSGVSMSFTAFPVLASLLTTLGLLHTPIGTRVLSCAAVDDVLSWCVLALASSFAQSSTALQGLYTCIGAIAFVVVMLFAVRPLLGMLHRRLLAKELVDSPYYMCLVMLLLIAAAFTTQGLGIHCFFGAFVMGLVTPKEGGFAENIAGRMELVTAELLLPLFFASSGIKTDIGALNTWRYWGIVLCLICIACTAKFTPACLVSKLLLRDKSWRFCTAVGVLMNTRGLVELIALNIGLTMGILSPRMFTMLLLMALATTCMTTPALTLLYRGRQHELLSDGDKQHQQYDAEEQPTSPNIATAAGSVVAGSGHDSGGGASVRKHARSSASIVFVYKRSSRMSEPGEGFSPLSLSPTAAAAAAAAGCGAAAAAAAAAREIAGGTVALDVPSLAKDAAESRVQDV